MNSGLLRASPLFVNKDGMKLSHQGACYEDAHWQPFVDVNAQLLQRSTLWYGLQV